MILYEIWYRGPRLHRLCHLKPTGVFRIYTQQQFRCATRKKRVKVNLLNQRLLRESSLLFSVNRLEPLRFIWLRDRGWRSHRGGFREGFRTPLASLRWVRRLAGWYMTYILPTDAIFVRAPAWKLVWVANKCRLCPPTLQSTCTLHKWQSLVCYSDFWIQSADAPSACQAIFSWAGILAAV